MSSPPTPSSRQHDPFHTTRWSVVLAAGRDGLSESSSAALETLCRTYWYPVYAYVRRRVNHVHQAQDMTQAFFHRLLENETIARADPDRGRFRAFLLTACKRFLANEWEKAGAAKRGGGRPVLSLDFELAETRYAPIAADPQTAESIYEQQWGITLLNSVLEKLRAEHEQRGKTDYFETLKPFLSGSRSLTHAAVAETLGTTEGAVKVAVHRLRARYREILRAEIAQTVDSAQEIDDEIRRLFEVMSQKHSKTL